MTKLSPSPYTEAWRHALQESLAKKQSACALTLNTTALPLPLALTHLRQALAAILATKEAQDPQSNGLLLRLSIPLLPLEPLAALLAAPTKERFYFADRQQQEKIAAWGHALTFSESETPAPSSPHNTAQPPSSPQDATQRLAALLQDAPPSLRFLGGQTFDPLRPLSLPWQPFGLVRWFLPRLAIEITEGRALLIAHALCHPTPSQEEENPLEALSNLERAFSTTPLSSLSSSSSLSLPSLTFHQREDRPTRKGWHEAIRCAKKLFTQGELQKLVLARESLFTGVRVKDPFSLLAARSSLHQDSYVFGFQVNEDTAFLGITPERLYRREGQCLLTEALAGTRRRGKDELEDQALGESLLSSQKDLHEQRLVLEDLLSRLHALGASVEAEKTPMLRRLRHLQHLWTPITAHLANPLDDARLLAHLHPTPAVGGLPRHIALASLRDLEYTSRGWYAAPLGWISRDRAEIAVAIRSALLSPQGLALYAGAGILPASQADAEWEEIEQKSRIFGDLLSPLP
jgi:menaquinone-specific isochorismate synthase